MILHNHKLHSIILIISLSISLYFSLRFSLFAGVRASGAAEWGAEGTNRVSEAGEAAPRPHAQPAPTHLYRPYRQCSDPREGTEPTTPAALPCPLMPTLRI